MKHDEEVELELSRMLADRPRGVSELALGLRRHVAKQAPGSSELLYHTYAVSDVFTYTGKLGQAFIHIATYAKHVNLGFNQGAKLDDPNSLLKGEGKLIRHIRIDALEDAKSKAVLELIQAATELGLQMAEEKGGKQPQAFQVKT